jgi:hypothetical protein
MKKIVFLFTLVAFCFSCNKDLVEKPDNLIDKKVMGNILYDMTLLEALKYQNSEVLYQKGINPKTYIFEKYKVDSLQFAKSNAFYAADYREYKKMFDELNDRLKKEKDIVDLAIKKELKNGVAIKKAKLKKTQDSIKKVKEFKLKKVKDSIAKVKAKANLRIAKEK